MKEKIKVKKDCFAYHDCPEPHCSALNKLYCETKKCRFYKTNEEKELEELKVKEYFEEKRN